ncbi:MAG: ATP synthase F1 subunit delta [Flavobacteriales bacterium]|nr:ATP synthase F1 subunit delta [Flavobacteriales bacterium]
MSINLKVAKRYSKGLYDFAKESAKDSLVYEEMKSLQNLIENSKELRNFFSSPILDVSKKTKIVKEIFSKYDAITKNFIILVVRHKRESHLLEISKYYQTIYENNNGMIKVYITSAVELDKQTLNSISEKSGIVPNNAKVTIINTVDESLIGGYILRVGDKQIDASIKTKLDAMRKNFNVNHYISKL